MPAIGARTTGVSTVTDPRVSEVGRTVTGSLSLLVRLLRLRRLLDLPDPGDRVELRGGPERHRGQPPVRRNEVDQAGGRLVTRREGRRQGGAGAGLELRLERVRLDQGAAAVGDVQRDAGATEVLVTEVLRGDGHVEQRRLPARRVELPVRELLDRGAS